MISETPLHALVARVVRRLDDWKDAEERYRSPRSDGRAWADLPKSIGAEFIRNQIASAQEALRSMRDELAALLLTAGPQETNRVVETPREVNRRERRGVALTALMPNAWRRGVRTVVVAMWSPQRLIRSHSHSATFQTIDHFQNP